MSLPARFQRDRHPLGAPRVCKVLPVRTLVARAAPPAPTPEASLRAMAEGQALAETFRRILRSQAEDRRWWARRRSTDSRSFFTPFYGGAHAATG